MNDQDTRFDLTYCGLPGAAIASTSPHTPDTVASAAHNNERAALHREPRILLDDQDSASGEMAGGSPTTKPTLFITKDHEDLPPQGRFRVPGADRLLAWLKGRVDEKVWVERIPRDECPFCRRR